MNNEPVAWKQIRAELNNEGDVIGMFTDISLNTGWEELPNGTPLYTHPVKELPTKEDEYWLMVEVLRAKVKEQQAEIAILRKAQEK